MTFLKKGYRLRFGSIGKLARPSGAFPPAVRRDLRASRLLCVVACLLLFSVQALVAVASPDVLAKTILQAVGRTNGICLDLGCGNGELALAIARNSAFFVQGLETDANRVLSARKALELSGLYGERIAVDHGSFARLPYPDYVANLVVRGDRFVDRTRGWSWKEVVRVLQPGGLAYVGQSPAAAARGQKMSAAALRTELNAAGVTDFEVIEKNGIWVKFRRPRPRGMGSWSHRRGGPGNTNSSADDLVRVPFQTLWIGHPRSFTKFGLLAASNGRFIMRHGGITHTGLWRPSTKREKIVAYDGYNGTRIWQVHLPDPMGEGLVAVDDSVYAVGGSKLTAFNAVDGTTRWAMTPSHLADAMKEWSYYACDAGVLVVGAREEVRGKKTVPPTKVLAALNPNTAAVLWTHTGGKSFSEMALGEGLVFFLDQEQTLQALDIQTGAERWTAPGRRGRIEYHRGILYTKGGTFEAKTGKRAMARSRGILAGEYVVRGGIGGIHATHLETGEKTPIEAPWDPYSPKTAIPRGGLYARCIAHTASSHCYFFSYSGSVIADLERGRLFPTEGFRANCRTGMIAGNGIAYNSASGCGCTLAIRGNVALLPVSDALYDAQPESNPLPQLEKGPFFGRATGPTEPAREWPAFRHDGGRNCTSVARLSTPLKHAWTITLQGELTPPSIGNGCVFVGSSNHSVYGLDASTGDVKWRYRTGGRIKVTPAYWKGKVYAGSQDGWVYCLDAATGELAWRFRGGPYDRKMVLFGRLESLWPIGGGVIVEEGVAYFYAGRVSHDRVFVYALNAESGDVIWKNEQLGRAVAATGPDCGVSPHGVSPNGTIAVTKDVLIIPHGPTFPAGVRRSDGKILYWNKRGDSTERSNINIQHLGGSNLSVGGNWLFIGGPYSDFGGAGLKQTAHFIALNPGNGRIMGQDDPDSFEVVGRDPSGKTILPQNYKWGVRERKFGKNIAPVMIEDNILIFDSYPGLYNFEKFAKEGHKAKDAGINRIRPGNAVAILDGQTVGASGNTYWAADLRSGAQLWKTDLTSTGPILANGLAVAEGMLVGVTSASEVIGFGPGAARQAP